MPCHKREISPISISRMTGKKFEIERSRETYRPFANVLHTSLTIFLSNIALSQFISKPIFIILLIV